MARLSMLVVECGTDSSGWMDACRCDSERVVVIAQQGSESQTKFLNRVRERVRSLAQQGPWPQRVAWLGNQDWDHLSLGRRAALLRTLASGLARESDGANVYLDSSDAASPRARHGVCALAWAAAEEARGTSVSIQVRRPAEVVAEMAAA